MRLEITNTKAAGAATTKPTTGKTSADSASLASGFAANVLPGNGMRLKKPNANINLVVKGRMNISNHGAVLDQPMSRIHKRAST